MKNKKVQVVGPFYFSLSWKPKEIEEICQVTTRSSRHNQFCEQYI
jgi:hypothetical protein